MRRLPSWWFGFTRCTSASAFRAKQLVIGWALTNGSWTAPFAFLELLTTRKIMVSALFFCTDYISSVSYTYISLMLPLPVCKTLSRTGSGGFICAGQSTLMVFRIVEISHTFSPCHTPDQTHSESCFLVALYDEATGFRWVFCYTSLCWN